MYPKDFLKITSFPSAFGFRDDKLLDKKTDHWVGPSACGRRHLWKASGEAHVSEIIEAVSGWIWFYLWKCGQQKSGLMRLLNGSCSSRTDKCTKFKIHPKWERIHSNRVWRFFSIRECKDMEVFHVWWSKRKVLLLRRHSPTSVWWETVVEAWAYYSWMSVRPPGTMCSKDSGRVLRFCMTNKLFAEPRLPDENWLPDPHE